MIEVLIQQHIYASKVFDILENTFNKFVSKISLSFPRAVTKAWPSMASAAVLSTFRILGQIRPDFLYLLFYGPADLNYAEIK